jgi:signal transduction histidine kinase
LTRRFIERDGNGLRWRGGDKLDADGKHYLERIQVGTRQMGQLIQDLLSLSRVTRKEMALEAVDLSALAEATTVALQESAPERGATFYFTLGTTDETCARSYDPGGPRHHE